MVRATILAGVLLGGTAGGSLFAQTAGAADSPFDWSSLVGGAIGSSPAAAVMAWRLNKRDKEVDALQGKLDAAQERTLAVVERAIPILTEATSTLADVRAGMEATIKRVPAEDIARAAHQLEELVADLARRERP